MKNTRKATAVRRGFTMIELLTVIAIIAILAAILFPIFGTVREQARQSSTMSGMQSIYQGVRLYYEDEGKYPSTLFGYAEVKDNGLGNPPFRPMTVGDANLPICASLQAPGPCRVPMNNLVGRYRKGNGELVQGSMYRDHIKSFETYLGGVGTSTTKTDVTPVVYPAASPLGIGGNTQVTWQGEPGGPPPACPVSGDPDLPNAGYIDQGKLFYKMDSMDIGPQLMLTPDQSSVVPVRVNNDYVYELHYGLDWTRQLGSQCDVDGGGRARVTQLKYKNPPTERTVITYNTHHVAVSGSGKIIVLLLSGTAKKVDAVTALKKGTFPLDYSP